MVPPISSSADSIWDGNTLTPRMISMSSVLPLNLAMRAVVRPHSQAVSYTHLVKILMLTAKGQNEDEVAGLSCGADDYLRKPFDMQVLLLRPSRAASPVLGFSVSFPHRSTPSALQSFFTRSSSTCICLLYTSRCV